MLQIREETSDPRRKVMVEYFTVGSCGRCNGPAGETCHDLQKNRGMVFRLRLSVYAFDANPLKRLANACKWATVQKAR